MPVRGGGGGGEFDIALFSRKEKEKEGGLGVVKEVEGVENCEG